MLIDLLMILIGRFTLLQILLFFEIDGLSCRCNVSVWVELNTDRSNIILFELFVLVHLKDGGFADRAIT